MRSTILKPDQHRDGGDEHDEIAGSKHVRRDRQRHCKQGWWISSYLVQMWDKLPIWCPKLIKYKYFSKISETWEWGITESWLADRLLCPITIVYHCMPYHTKPYNCIPLYTMPYQAIQLYTTLRDVILCHTTQHYTTRSITLKYHTKKYHEMPYHTMKYHETPYHTLPSLVWPITSHKLRLSRHGSCWSGLDGYKYKFRFRCTDTDTYTIQRKVQT